MRVSTIRNSVKEGLVNIFRHPLVTLASVTTIALMLFIMGAFTGFSMNARTMMARLSQQPPVELTLNLGITQDELAGLQAELEDDPNVLDFKFYTPEQNLESFKSQMEDTQLFDGFGAENLPYTVTVRLSDPSISESFVAQYGGIPGVNDVSLEVAVMKFLSKAIVWVNYATLVAFVALLAISLFIISNMVRVAVYSRAEEINIMKYVGATNWYIRIPFIIEGALVGLIGAVIAFAGVYGVYGYLFEQLMRGMDAANILAMIPKESLAFTILGISALTGISVGAVGSAFSVRKHVKV